MQNDVRPLVSCVMPTADRRPWVQQSIRYFLRQDYPNRELVIVDDGIDAVEDVVPRDPCIRYKRLRGHRTLGAKRNLCVAESRGDLILHWDDDDWFADSRISRQVDALLSAGAEICGLPRMLCHDLQSRRTWLYEFRERPWLAGNSLLYTKDFWARKPFPDEQVGEDTVFVWSQALERAAVLADYEIFVAMIHGRNTSPKLVGDEHWSLWTGDLRRILGDDAAFYDLARRDDAADPLRIGYLLECFSPSSKTSVRREIAALCGMGHEVFVYTPNVAPDPGAAIPATDHLTVRGVDCRVSLEPLADAIRADRVEHLHGSVMLSAQAAACTIAEALGLPFTVGVAGGVSLFTEGSAAAYSAIASSSACRGIVVEDAFIRDWLTSHRGVDPVRTIVIPTLLDLELYRLRGPRPPAPRIRILSVARFIERKGLADLIEAFQLLSSRRDDLDLCLAGGGPEEPRLRAAAASNPSIAFLGVLSEEECRDAYTRADVFCLPCRQLESGEADGTPIALLEAMAFELPIVTSDLLSLPRYVRDGSEGFLVPAGDSRAIADRLEHLCNNRDLRTTMGRRARRRVEELGDVAANAARLSDLFVASRRQPRLEPIAVEPAEPAAIETIERRGFGAAARVDIIVPTHGQEELTGRCFDSILAHTTDYRLVWIDNGSRSSSQMAIADRFARHQNGLSIRVRRNLGYVGGTNLALQAILGEHASPAEYVVLLNNDTEVTPQWLDRLIAPLELDRNIASAGPMTSSADSHQGWPTVFRAWQRDVPRGLTTASPEEASRMLGELFGDVVADFEMLAFFCTLLRKRVFAEIGLLDPRFGAGMAEDNDYCHRLRKAGHRLVFVPGAYVVHHHRTTFRSIYSAAEIAAMQQQNIARYRVKHGLL